MGRDTRAHPADVAAGMVNGLGSGRGRVVEVQRGRILAAIVKSVGEQGMGAVTVGDVVSRAGISRRTFYELFVDREACVLAAFEEGVGAVAAAVLPAYAQGGRWRERIRAALGALLGFLDEEPELAAFCVVGALSADERVLERRAQLLGVLQRAVEEGCGEASRGHEPAPLAAEGVVGAVFAVVHARLVARSGEPLSDLLGPLMGIVVLPYLGTAAAGRELARPSESSRRTDRGTARSEANGSRARFGDPLEGLNMRLTYRTLRVLAAIAAHPGVSNREVAKGAGILDQGQVSKLLARLESLGLLRNDGEGGARGAPNAWTLTDRGCEVEQALRASDSPLVGEAA
jgi:AcrR family transcriptional regulator